MSIHKGQVTEYIVRKKGHSVAALARSLNIKRRLLYDWFNEENLDPVKMCRIGGLIGHDFSAQLPHEFTMEVFNKCGCCLREKFARDSHAMPDKQPGQLS
jgi:hypothetical protein